MYTTKDEMQGAQGSAPCWSMETRLITSKVHVGEDPYSCGTVAFLHHERDFQGHSMKAMNDLKVYLTPASPLFY